MEKCSFSAALNATTQKSIPATFFDRLQYMLRTVDAYNATQAEKNSSVRLNAATVKLKELNAAASLRRGAPNARDDKDGCLFPAAHFTVFHFMVAYGADLFGSNLLEPTGLGAVPPEVGMLGTAAAQVEEHKQSIPTSEELEELQKREPFMKQMGSSLACHVYTRVIHCRDRCKNVKSSPQRVVESSPLYYKTQTDAARIAHEAIAVYMVKMKTLRQ